MSESIEVRARRQAIYLVEGSTKEALIWAISEIDSLRQQVADLERERDVANEAGMFFRDKAVKAQLEAESQVRRLLSIIEEAPHDRRGFACASFRNLGCNCWKKQALAQADGKVEK